jgi:hypothetical protein
VTLINLVYRRPDGVHAEGTLLTAADGSVAVSSVRRYDTSDGEMTRAAFTVPLGTQGVFLDPGTWNFELIGVSDGKGGYLSGDDAISTRTVPNSGTFDVDDLTEVSGSSGQGLAPEWKAYIDAAIAAVTVGAGGAPTGSGAGGAFIAVDVTDTTATGRSVMTAANAAAARTAIGAGTSSLVVGTASTDAKAGNYQPAAANVSDSTTVGRSVLTAVDAAAARTAIGAGTSSLVIGTTTGTAADGGTVQSLVTGGTVVPPNGATGRAVFAASTVGDATLALGLNLVNNTDDLSKPVSTPQQTAINTAITNALNSVVLDSERNIANGVAGLDALGKILLSVLPSVVALTVRQDPTTGVWPSRPVWPGMVMWVGTSPAPGGGTVTNGTGMVDSIDIELLGA